MTTWDAKGARIAGALGPAFAADGTVFVATGASAGDATFANAIVALGCAGWGAGQLEQELTEDSWLTVPMDAGLLFKTPLAARWQAAAGSIGVDLTQFADHSGHA